MSSRNFEKPIKILGRHKTITKKMIEDSQAVTKSNAAASRWLGINYLTYRKYAKLYGLFEGHLNPSGVGIKKGYGKYRKSLDEILDGKKKGRLTKSYLKKRLIGDGWTQEECNSCGYNEIVMAKDKVALLIDFIDDNSSNLVIDNINFTVPSEKFVTILGPSGCGKTTVLRCIVGVERPDGGKMKLGDEVLFSKKENLFIPTEKRGMGMVYQSYALWPHMTVFENVAYPLQIRNMEKDEIRKKVLDILKLVKLNGLEDRLVPNLSGGQQQRVSLARALVYNPTLLLLDEPLSNLDVVLRDEMRTELKDLQRRLKLTTIYVTHDRTEALSLSDHIIIMDKGVIKATGTPIDLLRDPPNSHAGIILGDMSLIKGSVSNNSEKTVEIKIGNHKIVCRKRKDWNENEEVGILIRGTEVVIHNNKGQLIIFYLQK